MLNVGFLEFQYKLSKNKVLRKPSCLFSRDRQNSGLLPAFQPGLDDRRKVFDKFDSNKDGKISQMEYKGHVESPRAGKHDSSKIFRVADFDGDGFINFKDRGSAQKEWWGYDHGHTERFPHIRSKL